MEQMRMVNHIVHHHIAQNGQAERKMRANMTLDDALRLFNEEIEKTQKELDILEQET